MISPRRILAFLRHDTVVAVSVVGLALNLLGALAPLVALANVAHYIVSHWVWVTAFVWIKFFKLFHIDIPPLLGFSLTIFAFHVGLATSGLKFRDAGDPMAIAEARTANRDRLVALVLYLPILWGTLSSAFGALASHMSLDAKPLSGGLVVLSFGVVVVSPILAFWLARPRRLIRRFLSVYVVAASILLLDALARFLDATGLRKVIAKVG